MLRVGRLGACRRFERAVPDRRRPQCEPVAPRPAAAIADQVGGGSGAEFALENFLELREMRREIAAVHAMAQRVFGFVEIAECSGDPAQFDEIARFPVTIGHFLGRCGQWRLAAQRAPGKNAEQCEFGGRQGKDFPGSQDAARGQVDLQFGRCQRVPGGFDGFVVAGATGEQRFRQAVAQADEGQFGERHLRLRAVDETPARQFEDMAHGCRVVEAAARLEGRRDQDVRELVLRATIERQRVAEKEAHRLAAAGDRDMQRAVGIGSELANQGSDAVGGAAVVFGRADVVERPAVGVFKDVDGVGGESDTRQRVVATEVVEPARCLRQQCQARFFGAAAGGDQVDLVGYERGSRWGDGEGVERFGDDLRRQAGDGDENATGIVVGVFAALGHGVGCVFVDRRPLSSFCRRSDGWQACHACLQVCWPFSPSGVRSTPAATPQRASERRGMQGAES